MKVLTEFTKCASVMVIPNELKEIKNKNKKKEYVILTIFSVALKCPANSQFNKLALS